MQQNITITTSDNHQLDAYECAGDNTSHGLIVLQEIFGVNHHIQNVCDQFAQEGFHVIAPALFDRAEKNIQLGYQPSDVKKGLELRAQIAPEETLLDIIASVQQLNYNKIGIVGYCWGGSLSWIAATGTKFFSAASCWYGGYIPSLVNAQPNCPVQMHFGEKDASIPLEEVETVRKVHPEVDIYVYKGADHGFGCAERPTFDEQAYNLAQHRTLNFFKKYL